MEKIKTILILTLSVAFIFLLQNTCNKQQKINEIKQLNNALNDTIQKSKDYLNREVSKRMVLQISNIKQLANIQIKDSTIAMLKEQVNLYKSNLKNNGSVTILRTETKIDTIIKTSISNKFDTVFVNNIEKIYPRYEFNLDTMFNGWITGNGVSMWDSTYLKQKIKNDYSIVVGYDWQKTKKGKNNYFKKKIPYAIVTNYNPYSNVKDMRTLEVKAPYKRFGLGPSIGLGMGVNTKGQFIPVIYVGFSLNYNLIQF